MRNIILACFIAGAVVSGIPAARAQEQKQKTYQEMIEEALEKAAMQGKKAEQWDARMDSVQGYVYVQTQENKAGTWYEARPGMPLEDGDKVKVGSPGSAELTLSDGGVIYLNSNTDLEIESLDRQKSSFFLAMGSLVAKIESFIKSAARTRDCPECRGSGGLFGMSIRTPTAVAAVRGTEFGVEYSPFTGETCVGVFDEGSVAVTPADQPDNEIMITQNREAVFKHGLRRIAVKRLERMSRHKMRISRARTRLKTLKRKWKKMTPAKRKKMRRLIMKKKAIRREKLKGVRRKMIKKRFGNERLKKPMKRRRKIKKAIDRPRGIKRGTEDEEER